MMGAVLAGSVLGMVVGAGCLAAGTPVLVSLAAWPGTGVLAVILLALWSARSRRHAAPAVLRPQRA